MFEHKSLNCYYCKSVILNLPKTEILKMDGLNFRCECCGHHNHLTELKFYKGKNKEPFSNTMSIDNIPGT